MYSGLTAKVKWEGEVSQSFSILQGVRQGGILSTHFYKTYLNDFLLNLESRALGKYIGNLYMGFPTVADDLLFLSSIDTELQLMFSLAYINSQEKRYIIHPQKSTAQRRCVKSTVHKSEILDLWLLGTKKVQVEPKLTHLGLLRTEKAESTLNIVERISVARRALYALIKTGVNGTNGLNPRISYRIYQVCVIPRLLYSLDVMSLSDTHIAQLQRFHISTLRKLQSLPERTASSVYNCCSELFQYRQNFTRDNCLLPPVVCSGNQRIKGLMERHWASYKRVWQSNMVIVGRDLRWLQCWLIVITWKLRCRWGWSGMSCCSWRL